MEPRAHPDSHELNDWPMYGPKNPEIAYLVDRLAYEHGLRIEAIEEIILQALLDRLSTEDERRDAKTGKAKSDDTLVVV